MAQFIRCPSCGFNIAPYMEFFDCARQALYDEVVYAKDSPVANYDPEKLVLSPGSVPELGEILDAIGITKRCCRTRMLATIKIDRMYK